MERIRAEKRKRDFEVEGKYNVNEAKEESAYPMRRRSAVCKLASR